MTRIEQQRFYQGTRWRRMARAAKRRDNWLCVRCGREGFTVAAQVVHHKRAINDGGEKLQLDNTESLCRQHHESHHHRGPSEEQKEWTEYLAQQRNL